MISYESDGSLNIALAEMLGYACSVNIRPWNEGISWSSTSDGETSFHDYSKELPIPISLLMREKKAQPWIDKIPLDIVHALEKFETRYSNVLFSTLWFISRYRHAYEYFLNQERIVWLMLQHAKYYRWPESFAASLFQQKRRTILEACGLPSSKSCLNFLSKFTAESFGPRQFKFIREALSTTDYSKVTHLELIDEYIVSFAKNFPELARSKIISQYAGKLNFPALTGTINDINRMAKLAEIHNVTSRICSCNNICQINRLHDKLVDITNRKMIDRAPDIKYPDPPIHGSEYIIPISSNKDLVIEGVQQHHCVSSYHNRILERDYYVYKVIHPERATLGVEKTRDNVWNIDELKTKFNKTPSDETTKSVYSWFSASYLSSK